MSLAGKFFGRNHEVERYLYVGHTHSVSRNIPLAWYEATTECPGCPVGVVSPLTVQMCHLGAVGINSQSVRLPSFLAVDVLRHADT